ncbi:hypothetical protein SDRG_01205 [Saprolegnia diclina VS20]|uniref:J domain-containing protein n=1 Tax=Saprolegnia diclina (strain VS20) TaxID=1156394 RepID=T0R4E5_SAPDV|nr:hypothetical protein SDRG_01205 [Saprolegnia diclina VS20]EQC41230.1 hypothetical protein SDRG_01205 [Saprolegnia diclina VS20]|eukprot:XP_008604944.1 hypothetical protein SDRG_01205 [Saprolegnia diclina VS20]
MAAPISEDLYELLEVERSASEAEIRSSYRKLALKYHPDRNHGTPGAEEHFKKLATAYAVLSDAKQRRVYDVSSKDGTPDAALAAFQGLQPIDVNEMNSLGRMLGALCSKMGIPLPTQISANVLAAAHDAVKGIGIVKDLAMGLEASGRVEKQEAHFFRLTIGDVPPTGIVISCRAAPKSKFKLILFDSDGGVRHVQECGPRSKYTSADIFMTSMEFMDMNESWKFLTEQEKALPEVFSSLTTLELMQTPHLGAGSHLFAVYGDNWFSALNYTVQCTVIQATSATNIQLTEAEMLHLRKDIDAFQAEFVAAQKAFEAVVAKANDYDVRTKELLQARRCAYETFFQECAEPYKAMQPARERRDSAPSAFQNLWSRFTEPKEPPKRNEF